MTDTVYSFSVKKLDGTDVDLAQYKGKVLMIVNTASECGFTPQLRQLEELRKTFGEQQFEVLAFPSNDFGKQEPLTGPTISRFCVINFGAHYPIFEKIHVIGNKAHPLYKFLARKVKKNGFPIRPRWNFHKYIIDREGNPVDYFYPFTSPTSERVKKRIAKLLANSQK